MHEEAAFAVFLLNCVQVFLASLTVVTLLITRWPVTFFAHLEQLSHSHQVRGGGEEDPGQGGGGGGLPFQGGLFASLHRYSRRAIFVAVLKTSADPIPCWYTIYLACTLLALLYHRLFLSGLLLDW
jgi:hypothetical protein